MNFSIIQRLFGFTGFLGGGRQRRGNTHPPHHLRKRRFPMESGVFLKGERTIRKKNVRDRVRAEEKGTPAKSLAEK